MSKIYRDELGVPHIMATTYVEVTKALAYVHSEDDFFTLQLWFLAIKQKAGHFDDWDGPYLDFISEFFDIKKCVSALLPQISEEYLQLADSYCQGINKYAIEHKDDVLDYSIFPVDSNDLFQVQHLMEVIGIQIDKPYSYLDKPVSQNLPHKEGSNVIAIGKSKSNDGHAKIAISPHQMLEGIYSYYEVHLNVEVEGLEYHGFLLPCSFAFFMGTNFQVAWGSTASYPEMYNIYKIDISKKIGQTKSFRFEGRDISLKKRYYKNYTKLYGKISTPIVKSYFETELGNVIEIKGNYYLISIDMLGKKFGAEMIYHLSKCKTNKEVLDLSRKSKYPYLDLVCIDKNDNLLYVHNSNEKVRKDKSLHYYDILDIAHMSEELSATYYEDNLITEVNPICDYIVSANQSPLKVTNLDKSAKQYRGLIYQNENSRSCRIKNILNSIDLISIDDLKSILLDYKITFPIIRNVDLSVIFNHEIERYSSVSTLVQLIRDWDGDAHLQSEAAAVFALFFYKYKEKYYVYSKNPDVIKKASVSEVVDCLKWVNKYYKKGKKLGDIQYLKRENFALPIAGVPDSVNTVRPYLEKGKLYVEEASAFRMIIDLENHVSLTCHPYGTSSNEEDPNFASQMKMFTEGEYKELKTFDYYQNKYNFYEL